MVRGFTRAHQPQPLLLDWICLRLVRVVGSERLGSLMALKAAPIWGCAKIPCSHLGVSDLGSRRSGFALNLRHDLERFRKLECCCLGALAHRAITPVEDEKPCVPGADSSGAIERTQRNESMGFHKDLNLLPSEFT